MHQKSTIGKIAIKTPERQNEKIKMKRDANNIFKLISVDRFLIKKSLLKSNN